MATNTKSALVVSSSSSKRLLFDRRYGWVFDEWNDPSQQALAGGRGMFCLLPLARAFLNTASQSINLATTSAVEVFERAENFSTESLHASLGDQLNKFTSFIQKPQLNGSTREGNSSTSCSPHLQMEN